MMKNQRKVSLTTQALAQVAPGNLEGGIKASDSTLISQLTKKSQIESHISKKNQGQIDKNDKGGRTQPTIPNPNRQKRMIVKLDASPVSQKSGEAADLC